MTRYASTRDQLAGRFFRHRDGCKLRIFRSGSESQIEELQGGIFHFVGIFVGIGFFRCSINLINTVLYKSNSIPIVATELTKSPFF